jgi:hypothetical protein
MGAVHEFGEGLRRVVLGAYRPADDRGSMAEGQFRLGLQLESGERVSEAEAAYSRADMAGHPAAACNLGVLREARGDIAGAEAAYRRAAKRGDANGAFNLGVLLEESDDRAGAERAYGRADRLGHAAAAGNLGVLLAEQGHVGAAEAAFRRADERGDPNAAANLAALRAPAAPSELAIRPRALRRGPVLALGASALLASLFAIAGVGALSGGGSSPGPAAPKLTHASAAVASAPDLPSPGTPAGEPRSSHRSHVKPAARPGGHRGRSAAHRSVKVQKPAHRATVSHPVTSHRSSPAASVPAATPVVTRRPISPTPEQVVQTTPPPAPAPSTPATSSPPSSSGSGRTPDANSGSGSNNSPPSGSGSASGGDLSGAGNSGSSGSGNASGGG